MRGFKRKYGCGYGKSLAHWMFQPNRFFKAITKHAKETHYGPIQPSGTVIEEQFYYTPES